MIPTRSALLGAWALIAVIMAVVGVVTFSRAQAARGEASAIDRAIASGHSLAMACYKEGMARGRLQQAIKDQRKAGNEIPPDAQALADQPPTEGCR